MLYYAIIMVEDLRILGDLDFSKQPVVILRADLDVDPGPTLGARLSAIRLSIDYVLRRGAERVVIIGHRGRPEGKKVPELSTELLVDPLQKALDREIAFAPDFNQVPDGQVVLFENVRFWKGEENGDVQFAQTLAGLGNVCVSDAFGTFHRPHASITLLPKLLPSACGIQAEKEYTALSKVLQKPEHPFVLIVGGAKIKDKLAMIRHLITTEIADEVLIGGLLPTEIGPDDELRSNDHVQIATLTLDGHDIDPATIGRFGEVIRSAGMVLWNGDMGFVEGGSIRGTDGIIQAIRGSSAYSIIGGGDTTQYIYNQGSQRFFGHISTGGGAMLEFLTGQKLPGFAVLRK